MARRLFTFISALLLLLCVVVVVLWVRSCMVRDTGATSGRCPECGKTAPATKQA